MKSPLLLAALAASTLMAAPATLQTAERDNAGSFFSFKDEDWSSRIRLTAGGYGNFGSKMELSDPAASTHGDLYGTRLDLQLKLYTKECFNLWVGLGGSWTPEQEFGTYSENYSEPDLYTETFNGKMELRSYALRAMVVPEWQVLDPLALGLRLGVEVGRNKAKFSESWSYTDIGGTEHDSWNFENAETLVRGIAGLQATWMFTEHIGLTAYGEGQFGQDMNLEIDGEKFGTLKGTAFEAGIGLTWQF
ncbi:MAG: hypothetical protein ACI4W7_02070 [Candidatus Spyradenecus sp.]